MDSEHPDGESTDALVKKLRERVEERRRSGFYPPGLEEEMAEHFRRIQGRAITLDLEELRRRARAVSKAAKLDRKAIGTKSRVPGGNVFHRLVARVTSRQVDGVVRQTRAFADEVAGLLEMILDALDDPGPHVHAELLTQIDAILERFAEFDRTPSDPRVALAQINRRLEALEAEARRESGTR